MSECGQALSHGCRYVSVDKNETNAEKRNDYLKRTFLVLGAQDIIQYDIIKYDINQIEHKMVLNWYFFLYG